MKRMIAIRAGIPLHYPAEPAFLSRVLAEVHLAAVNGKLIDVKTTMVQPADEVKVSPAMDGG